jgi:hypothetical protein
MMSLVPVSFSQPSPAQNKPTECRSHMSDPFPTRTFLSIISSSLLETTNELEMAYKLLVTVIIPLVSATAPCYWPDGSIAKTNVPCSSAPNASCCGSNNICLSNNLCLDVFVQPYVLSRGGCTDPNWESDQCASVCRRSYLFISKRHTNNR